MKRLNKQTNKQTFSFFFFAAANVCRLNYRRQFCRCKIDFAELPPALASCKSQMVTAKCSCKSVFPELCKSALCSATKFCRCNSVIVTVTVHYTLESFAPLRQRYSCPLRHLASVSIRFPVRFSSTPAFSDRSLQRRGRGKREGAGGGGWGEGALRQDRQTIGEGARVSSETTRWKRWPFVLSARRPITRGLPVGKVTESRP